MSFALSALRTKTRRLIGDEDTTNTHFDDSELLDYLNQASLFMATEMEWPEQTSTATSVQSQALYALPSDFVALIDVYFDNLPLTIVDREDLKQINPAWQDADDATPQYLYKADNAVMGLYPPPDAAHAGLDIQIQYISIPADMATDTDIPDLHTAFQIALPFYAAYLCDYKLGNLKASQMHFAQYDLHRKRVMSKVQGFADDTKRFRWPGSL